MFKTLLVTTALVMPVAALAQTQYQGQMPQGQTASPLPASNARLHHASIEPATIRPGDTIRLAYGFDFAGAGSNDGGPRTVQLLGLPPNTIAVGTTTTLNQPIDSTSFQFTEIRVLAPAAAGTYPLKIRVAGSQSERIADLGTLTIQDVPGRVTGAQLVPASEPALCNAGLMPVAVRYTAEDPNGAADLKQVMLQTLSPVAGGTILVPQNPAPGSYTVTQQANGTYLVTPVQPVVQTLPSQAYLSGSSGAPLITGPVPEPGSATTVPGAITYGPGTGPNTITTPPGAVAVVTPAPQYVQPYQQVAAAGAPIQAPSSYNVIQETVQAAVRLPCLNPYPAPWQVGISAIDIDDVTGQPRQQYAQ